MQTIKTLFERDGRRVIDKVSEGCEWVTAGEGVATRKWDGTSCMVYEFELYRRHRLKEGKDVPPGWRHWTGDPEQRSGHGWLPVGPHPTDVWHREALITGAPLVDGTYELIGPSIQKNVEGQGSHILIRHGHIDYTGCPRDFEGLKVWLSGRDIEGIVWHHPDGRMVKIKLRDFGLVRGVTS